MKALLLWRGLWGATLAPDAERQEKLGDLIGPLKGPILELHLIDVGQGDALLIRSSSGKNVLIDSGPLKAAKKLLSYLDEQGVEQLDLVINTHAHADHIGGLPKLLKALSVKQVLDPIQVHPSSTYEKMIAALEAHQIPLKAARRGRRIGLGAGAQLRILGPREPLIKGSRSDTNSNSVILKLEVGNLSFLFMGDAEQDTEERLLRDGAADLRATVLKVAHHGSAHASSEHFLKAVQPRIALISCALKNNYGHPAPPTLKRLSAYAALFQTPQDGDLLLRTDGKYLEVKLSKVKSEAKSAQPKPIQAELININTAEADELKRLPGVGKKTAARILSWREEHGPFLKIEDLLKVKGIGSGKLRKLRSRVSL